jgi:hypothetical protein
MWFNIDAGGTQWKWYKDASVKMTLTGNGNLAIIGTDAGYYFSNRQTGNNGYQWYCSSDVCSLYSHLNTTTVLTITTAGYLTTTGVYSSTTAVNYNSTVNMIPTYNTGSTQYRLLARLPPTGDGANGMTMAITGTLGYYGDGNYFIITIKNRFGYSITSSSQGTATVSTVANNVDLVIYTISGYDYLYLLVKPGSYPWFDFYISARDYAGIVYLPKDTSWSFSAPGGTTLYSSILNSFTNLTNTGYNGVLNNVGDIRSSGQLWTSGTGSGLRLNDRNQSIGTYWFIYDDNLYLRFWWSGNDIYRFYTDGNAQKIGSSALWTNFSDFRLKENIVLADLDICYENIKKLKLKRFNFKEGIVDEADKNVLGFIAQDVQKIFNKSVSVSPYAGIEDCLWLNETQILRTLYGAVQKIIEKIETPSLKGKGTIPTGSESTVISVPGGGNSIIQVTPIFNVNTGVRTLNVSEFDSSTSSFTVYGAPGDFYWSISST